jgi:adenosylcobinamide amidohydrolase
VRPLIPTLLHRSESDTTLPVLVWRFPGPVQVIASGPLGGGAGIRRWVINATVDRDYARLDPDRHLDEIARGLDLEGPGVGMLTAVDVRRAKSADEDGVAVVATVGLGQPTWAAAEAEASGRCAGTINVFAWIPVPLAPAALVNAVITATEAKVQALCNRGIRATGTATDAICVACPIDGGAVPVEPFGGPRSTWGAKLGRAAHRAVLAGTTPTVR